MTTSPAGNTTPSASPGPAWASWLGVVAIVLGVFLAAEHGNEWMTQYVMSNYMPAAGIAADCPEDELAEEGLALEECEYLLTHIYGLEVSTPDWFPRAYLLLSGAGAVFAFLSVVIGGALVNYRPWAVPAAVIVFGILASIDMFQFFAVVNTGPIIRQIYLTHVLLWLVLHLIMLAGAVAGKHAGEAPPEGADVAPASPPD